MTLSVFGSIGQGSCRMSPNLNLSDVFLIIRLSLQVFGEKKYHTGKIPLSSHPVEGSVIATWHCWWQNLQHLIKVVCQVPPLLLFPCSLEFGKSSPPLMGLMEIKLLWGKSLLHSFTLVVTHVYLFYGWVIIQLYFCCSDCPNFGHWESFQVGSCVPLICLHPFIFLSTFLLSDTYTIFSLPQPCNSQVSKSLCSFNWRMVFRNQDLAPTCFTFS